MTYKTAYRIGMQIRKLMADAEEFTALKGHVEIDEHFHGGRIARSQGKPRDNKTIIVGMKERGGPFRAEVAPDTKTSPAQRSRPTSTTAIGYSAGPITTTAR